MLTFNFGDEVDRIYVNKSSEAIHVLNLGDGDDYVEVRALSGPLIINGDEGTDVVKVSTDEQMLDRINSLIAFDGGQDSANDTLVLDDSGDYHLDDVVNVTRLFVEVASMEIPEVSSPSNASTENPILPRESYLIMLRNSTGGSFNLTFTSINLTTPNIAYPTNASTIELAIRSVLIPEGSGKTCGKNGTSWCSDAAKVWQLGQSDAYLIFFVGEYLNSGIGLTLNTDGLDDFYSETFLNKTNDILAKNSDVAYTNVDELRIHMGHQDIVSNIRGTSASYTFIETQEGDDKFFVASDANENGTGAPSTTVLYGLLDYIEGDLFIQSKTGQHRLLMSDSFSDIPKGVGTNGFAVLSNSSLINLGDNVGDIFYSSFGGNWSDDVTLWMGTSDDKINVVSIPSEPGPPSRTTTSVHCGRGRDVVHVNLAAEENVGGLFVANGQVRSGEGETSSV